MKTVISTIAIKFLEEGGSGFIKLEPLVSKPAPEWLLKQKNFIEAREKGLVRATEDVVNTAKALDKDLVVLATKLKIPFTAETSQATLEQLVKEAQEKAKA